jgi:hypothetical protein
MVILRLLFHAFIPDLCFQDFVNLNNFYFLLGYSVKKKKTCQKKLRSADARKLKLPNPIG